MRATVALGIAVWTGLAAVAAGEERASSPFGINIHLPYGHALSPLLESVEEAGIGWVRIDVAWPEIEPTPGDYDWTRVDALVAEARARGLEILGILAYTPAWATDGPAGSGEPRDVGDWTRFCSTAAARYAGAIDVWEIWNEPNLPRFWVGTRNAWIESILIPGAEAVRAANPRVRVAGPALAHLRGRANWYGWLYEVLVRAGDRLDIVSHHLYAPSDSAVSEQLGSRTHFGDEPSLWIFAEPSVREVLAAAGWSGPFWLTETGWEAQGAVEVFRAVSYRRLLEEWFTGRRGRGWIERIFFYELKDEGDSHWGILRADGRRKLAWFVYRDFIAVYARLAPRAPSSPIDKVKRREHPRRGS